MSTVIDELIVSLSLDPTGFTKGQQQAVDNLNKFEQQARQTANKINRQATDSGLSMINAINNPIGALKRALEDIVRSSPQTQAVAKREYGSIQQARSAVDTEARRSGEAIYAGGMRGAAGIQGIALAGLAAFAAIEALNKGLEAAHRQSEQMANLGRAAWELNVDPQKLGAFTMTAHQLANIPEQQSIGALQSFQQTRQRYKTLHEYPPEFQKFAYLFGMPPDQVANMDLFEMITRLSGMMQGENGAEVRTRMEAVGLGTFTQLVAHPPQEIQKTMQENLTRAPTKSMTERATEFQKAWNTMEDAFTGLFNKLTDDVNPQMVEFLKNLTKFADWLRNHTDILWIWLKAMLTFGTMGAAAPLLFGPETPKGPEDTRTWWQRTAPTWAGGKAAPAAAPGSGGGGNAAAGGPWSAPTRTGTGEPTAAEIDAGLRASAARYGVNPEDVIALANAEGRGAPFKEWDVNEYSYGALRGHIGGLATEFQKATHMDPSLPENQIALNDWMIKYGAQHGWSSWTSVTGGRVRAPGATGAGAPPAPGGGGVTTGGKASGVNPVLTQAMAAGFQAALPAGYTARVTSGVRNAPGDDPGSYHFGGQAEDWQIYGPDGKPIDNKGEDTSGLYRSAAVQTYAWLLRNHPELARQYGWGGHFGTQLHGGGPPDLMHGDFGGMRGRYGDPTSEYEEAKRLVAGGGGTNAPVYTPNLVPGDPRLAMRQPGNAASASTSYHAGSANNDNSKTANVGQVVVNVQPPINYGAGGAIGGTIHNMIVGNANAGTH